MPMKAMLRMMASVFCEEAPLYASRLQAGFSDETTNSGKRATPKKKVSAAMVAQEETKAYKPRLVKMARGRLATARMLRATTTQTQGCWSKLRVARGTLANVKTVVKR